MTIKKQKQNIARFVRAQTGVGWADSHKIANAIVRWRDIPSAHASVRWVPCCSDHSHGENPVWSVVGPKGSVDVSEVRDIIK